MDCVSGMKLLLSRNVLEIYRCPGKDCKDSVAVISTHRKSRKHSLTGVGNASRQIFLRPSFESCGGQASLASPG